MGESSGITFCGGGRGAALFLRIGATGSPLPPFTDAVADCGLGADSTELRELVELYWDLAACPFRMGWPLVVDVVGAAYEFLVPAFILPKSAELKLLVVPCLASAIGTSRISFRPTSPIVHSFEKTSELSPENE